MLLETQLESEQHQVDDPNPSSCNLYLTSDAWINNGIVRLGLELKTLATHKIFFETNGLKLEKEAIEKIPDVLHKLAARGTYNFNTNLKRLNLVLRTSYSRIGEYPTTIREREKSVEIPKAERELFKAESNRTGISINSKEKIWKKRNSFIFQQKPFDCYKKYGIEFRSTKEWNNLKMDLNGTNRYICPICGLNTGKLFDIKQSINPFNSEHHNNEIEGVSSNIRKNSKACSRCIVSSLVSLFDYYIPFFSVPYTQETYLALPSTKDLHSLRKILNNLSVDGQYIKFDEDSVLSYSTNIQSLPNRSKAASLLALLHNIKNRYHKDIGSGPQNFLEIEKEEFINMVDWIFISTGFCITRLKASEKVYKIMEGIELEDGRTAYLVPDLLCNFRIKNMDSFAIEQFYESILTLDNTRLSKALFEIAKKYSQNQSVLGKQGLGDAIFLWKNYFLDRILEVSMKMDIKTKKACRELAQSIGKNFKKDVGMLTKFANAVGPEDFKNAIEDALYRLAKISIDKPESKIWMDRNDLEVLYESLETEEDYNNIKNYFVSLMSISVISANYTSRNQKMEG